MAGGGGVKRNVGTAQVELVVMRAPLTADESVCLTLRRHGNEVSPRPRHSGEPPHPKKDPFGPHRKHKERESSQQVSDVHGGVMCQGF